jgi:hypothetical protein
MKCSRDNPRLGACICIHVCLDIDLESNYLDEKGCLAWREFVSVSDWKAQMITPVAFRSQKMVDIPYAWHSDEGPGHTENNTVRDM